MHSSVNEGVKGNGMSPGEKKQKKPFLCRVRKGREGGREGGRVHRS